MLLLHSDDVCLEPPLAPGGQPQQQTCALSALQRRASGDAADLRLRRQGGEARSTGGWKKQVTTRLPPSVDYREDVRQWDRERGDGPLCTLPRKSLAEAERAWSSVLARLSSGGDASALLRDHSPWAPDRPRPNPDALFTKARAAFVMELFGGGPGVVEGVGVGWPAMRHWNTTEALVSRLAEHRLSMETFTLLQWSVEMDWLLPEDRRGPLTLADYLRKNESAHNNYIFTVPCVAKEPNLGTFKEVIGPDVEPHPEWAATVEEQHGIVSLDAIGASHGFHFHPAVWLTQILGRKAWWLLPPSVPGKDIAGKVVPLKGDLHDTAKVPVVGGEAVESLNTCEYLRRRAAPTGALFCALGPGETMILPDTWWHSTCALDDMTAAAGGFLADMRTGLEWLRDNTSDLAP